VSIWIWPRRFFDGTFEYVDFVDRIEVGEHRMLEAIKASRSDALALMLSVGAF